MVFVEVERVTSSEEDELVQVVEMSPSDVSNEWLVGLREEPRE